MFWILAFVALFLAALFIVDFLIAAPGYKGPKSDHFNGKKFGLPDQHKARSLFDIIKWGVSGDRGTWIEQDENNYNLQPKPFVDEHFAVTFVNHSTFLLQVDGLNILTDPIWSDRASPYSWIGPKRMRPPGIQFEDLPEIDCLLISHNHYDHLDLPTVLKLRDTFNPRFIAPLGVSEFLKKKGIVNSVDLDWWDEFEINSRTSLHAVPARHFSGRGVFDRDKTLWSGFVLQSESGTIYFAGDTAYGDFFPKISERFSPIDLALIPIGAYKPRWFMQSIHCNPGEAVQIHKEVNAKLSIAAHFGTFPLADEGMYEPSEDLEKALEKYNISKKEFIALEEGEVKTIYAGEGIEALRA